MFVNSKEEENFFISHLNNQFTVLEYGSGSSTIEISNLCRNLVSIEHNKKWYDELKSKLPNNVKLIFKSPDIPYEEGGHDGTYEQFKSYILSPLEYGPFDIIFIDGRARVECAKFIKNVSHKNTIIFIHDFTSRIEVDNYKEIFKYLYLVESVEDMSKFKIKNI